MRILNFLAFLPVHCTITTFVARVFANVRYFVILGVYGLIIWFNFLYNTRNTRQHEKSLPFSCLCYTHYNSRETSLTAIFLFLGS